MLFRSWCLGGLGCFVGAGFGGTMAAATCAEPGECLAPEPGDPCFPEEVRVMVLPPGVGVCVPSIDEKSLVMPRLGIRRASVASWRWARAARHAGRGS